MVVTILLHGQRCLLQHKHCLVETRWQLSVYMGGMSQSKLPCHMICFIPNALVGVHLQVDKSAGGIWCLHKASMGYWLKWKAPWLLCITTCLGPFEVMQVWLCWLVAKRFYFHNCDSCWLHVFFGRHFQHQCIVERKCSLQKYL